MAEPDPPAENTPEYVIEGYDVEVSERIALLPAGPEAPPVRAPAHG
ncbi:hypothetical protein [Couchioplanes azureus]|nr:hypothetical protein [Couchioplanes caeruleus]GGQ70069.1 hypothetical protein GCM10010166_44880 [Couchioplanes caeruleus subsp. azureus]